MSEHETTGKPALRVNLADLTLVLDTEQYQAWKDEFGTSNPAQTRDDILEYLKYNVLSGTRRWSVERRSTDR